MSRAVVESASGDRSAHPRVDRGRRGFLTISAVTVGAGLATTACGSPAPAPVANATARDVLATLSTTADPKTNTDALNAAVSVAATTGAHVVLPVGEYGFLGMILPTKGRVRIEGAGRGVTVLRNEGPTPSITAHGVGGEGNDAYASDWAISGLSLTAAKRQADQIALSVKLASRFTVTDLLIRGHGVGVRHESGWDCGYDGVSVADSGTGWSFPSTSFAPSAPVGLRNCSAVNCDAAANIADGVEALEWIGGDLSGCGKGITVRGNESRSISIHGLNFERIHNEDLVIGDENTGPSVLAVNGCRFFRVDKGTVSVRFVRGDAATFNSCRWNNYGTAVEQGDDSGLLVINTSSGFEVDQFLSSRGRVQSAGVLNASLGDSAMALSLSDASVLPAVAGVEGIATKILSGAGRDTVSDDDFAIPPRPGSIAVLLNETDNTVRQAVRGDKGWFLSAPYAPAPAP